MEIRTSAPSGQPNNQDVFIWALYLLGGADKDVDVEAIYLKCFELAPARLGWRTRPDLPDYKKTSKALQSVEAKTHAGLVHKPNALHRRLTPAGVEWVQRYEGSLRQTYSGSVSPAAATNQNERVRQRLQQSAAWRQWRAGESFDLIAAGQALQCSPASPEEIWAGRLHEIVRASDVLGDDGLRDFAAAVKALRDKTKGRKT